MNRDIKILAELLSERKYFDLEEIEDLIDIHFKLWVDDYNSEGNGIIKKRNRLLNEQEQIKIQKFAIEKQLLIAKSELKEGKKVDTNWMAKANLASRIKGTQIVRIQNQLSNLKTIEKQINIDKSKIQNEFEFQELRNYVHKLLGKEKFIELMQSIRNKLTNEKI